MQLLQRMQLLHTGIARRAAPHSATSRRALLAGLATALGSSQASASDAIVTARAVSAQRIAAERLSLEEAYVLYARAAELEEELEAQLLSVLAPQSESYDRAVRAEALMQQLEMSGGRQRRSGWGESDRLWDLPFVGGWDLLFSAGGGFLGGPAAVSVDGRVLPRVSARQWVYGPGDYGVATECAYSSYDTGGGVLLARNAKLTKLAESAMRVDFAATAPNVYRWPSREPLRAEALGIGTPLGRGGLRVTTYLSDVMWISRSSDGSDANVLQRTEEEAAVPQMTATTPDGYDATLFGPGGRKLWKQSS